MYDTYNSRLLHENLRFSTQHTSTTAHMRSIRLCVHNTIILATYSIVQSSVVGDVGALYGAHVCDTNGRSAARLKAFMAVVERLLHIDIDSLAKSVSQRLAVQCVKQHAISDIFRLIVDHPTLTQCHHSVLFAFCNRLTSVLTIQQTAALMSAVTALCNYASTLEKQTVLLRAAVAPAVEYFARDDV